MPWLVRDRHVGALCDALLRAGVDPEGWNAQDLLEHIEADHRRSGSYTLPAGSQRDPLGLFVHQVRRAIGGVEPAPRYARRYANERRLAEAAAWRAQAADQRAAAAPLPQDLREQMRSAVDAARYAARNRTAADSESPERPEPKRGE
jgi:hypothetical protein